MEKKVSIRIGLDGKAHIVGDLREIGVEGKSAGEKTAYGFDKASEAGKRLNEVARKWAEAQVTQSNYAAMFGIGGSGKSAAESFKAFEEEASRLEQYSQAKARQIGENFQNTLNAAMGIGSAGKSARESASVFEEETKQIEELDRQAAALKAQINPLAAAQERLNAETAQYNALLRAGKITQVEHTAAMAAATTRYNQVANAAQRAAVGNRLNAFQISNLTFQINDVVSGLAMGQKPLSIITQQGGQIYQVFAGTGMGVVGALKATASTLASMISPTLLYGAAIGAAFATVGAAYASYISTEKKLEASLSGVGKASGATVERMREIADITADAGGVSVAAARDMEIAFAKTGKIGVESFSGLIAVMKNYAATTDQDMDKAREELTAAFADPAKGADTLNAKLGFLDDKTRSYIVTLANQNDRTAAQKALLEALIPALDNAADHATALGRAWDWAGRKLSDFWNYLSGGIGEAIEGQPLIKQLSDLQKERADASKGVGRVSAVVKGEVVYDKARSLKDIDADIAAVQAKIAAMQKKAQDAADASAAKTASVEIGAVARAWDADVEAHRKLVEQAAALNKQMADPSVTKRIANLDQAKRYQDALNRAVSSYIPAAEKARQLDVLDAQALTAKTPEQRAEIARKREEIELSGKLVAKADAEAQIARAGAKAQRDAAESTGRHTDSIGRQTLYLGENAKSALAAASAWLKSAEAGMEAEARMQATGSAIRKGAQEDIWVRQQLAETVAQQALETAKAVSDLDAHAEAQKRANDAVAAGRSTYQDALQQMQVDVALRPLIAAQVKAEGEAREKLTEIITRYRKAAANDNAESRRGTALQQIESQRSEIALLEAQIGGARPDEIKALQEKQKLIESGVDATGKEGQAILANTQRIQALNKQLDLTKSANSMIASAEQGIFDQLGEMMTSSEQDWGDYFKSIYMSFEKLALQLMLINPLKNMILGGDANGNAYPTLANVGGWLGSLLGNEETIEPITVTGTKGALSSASASSGSWISQLGSWFAGLFHDGGMVGVPANSNRMLPANVVRFAPRLHDGAYLAADEVPAILQTGERVLNRSETKRYNQGGGVTYVPVTIQAANPQSFKASRGQISASLARAVQSGARRI